MPALSATLLCRSALVILCEKLRAEAGGPWPERADAKSPVSGLFGLYLWVNPDDLNSSLEAFATARLVPAITAWVQEFREQPLGDQYLNLPHGALGSANERYSGIAMRCIIHDWLPIGDRNVPSQVERYYDVLDDSFKEEPCSRAVSFWVHTPDTKANLAGPQDDEDMRKLAKVK